MIRQGWWHAAVLPAAIVVPLAGGVAVFGGFRPAAVQFAVLVAGAAAVALPSVVARVRRTSSEVVVAAAAAAVLGSCFAVRGVVAGNPWSGLPGLGLGLAVSFFVVTVHLVPPVGRRRVETGLLWVGAVAALTGWAGVLWRLWPLAVADQGLWRASGPLGYPNALAALVVPLALVAAGRLLAAGRAGQAPARTDAVLLTLLVMGALGSLSRGGAFAAVVGVVLLLAIARPWDGLVVLSVPLAAGCLAGLAVVPSLSEYGQASPLVAVAGLATAVALAASVGAVAARASRSAAIAVAGAGLAVAAGLVAAVPGAAALLGSVVATRGSLSSSWRVDQHRAAWEVVASRPLTGAGPGAVPLEWTTADGTVLRARYVHDEYVQVLAEVGAVGGVLLVAVLAALAAVAIRGIRGARTAADGATAAAAVAGAGAAFAVHSAFDFLWHLPALPLVVVTLLACHSRPPKATRPDSEPDSERDSEVDESSGADRPEPRVSSTSLTSGVGREGAPTLPRRPR
ncbi:MAG: O-antigen ligase family protein [Actinomycetales bacterium]